MTTTMTRRRHQNRNSTTPRSQPPPPKPQHQQRQDSTLFGSSISIKSCRLLPRNPTLPYKTTNGCIIPNKTFYWQPTWPCCDWIPPRRRRLGGNPIGTVCHHPRHCKLSNTTDNASAYSVLHPFHPFTGMDHQQDSTFRNSNKEGEAPSTASATGSITSSEQVHLRR